MVVRDFHIICITFDEAKADTPLIVHRDGMLSFSVSSKSVKTVAWGYCQVRKPGSQIYVFQPPYGSPDQVSGQAFGAPTQIEALGLSIGKRLNHDNVMRHVTLVNGVNRE